MAKETPVLRADATDDDLDLDVEGAIAKGISWEAHIAASHGSAFPPGSTAGTTAHGSAHPEGSSAGPVLHGSAHPDGATAGDTLHGSARPEGSSAGTTLHGGTS